MIRLAIYGVITYLMSLFIESKEDIFQFVVVVLLMVILGEVVFMRDEIRKGGHK